ncbi:MAG: DNA-processing protein DprA [Deltaproteobacteria bacterium]|nr:DNA-processing protein DprA [Deltaproteobacteria bacterium]
MTSTNPLERLLHALDRGSGFDDVDEPLLWACLDAAGVTGAWREAVIAAGGPARVLEKGAVPAFAEPSRRARLLDYAGIAMRVATLDPWLRMGGRVVADPLEMRRFMAAPVTCFYGAGTGRVPDPLAPVVAVVGSREADIGYIERTARVCSALAEAGVVVCSGGARGVDKAAQKSARLHQGSVVVVSPEVALKRPDDVAVDPGLCWLSPFAPWSRAAKWMCVERNTWIAAAADVVVVICGDATSGTRHTVTAALRMGRPVVTLPVLDVHSKMSVIPRALLEHGIGHEIDDDVDVDALLRLQPRAGAREAWSAFTKGQAQQPALPGFLREQAAFDDDAPALLRLLRASGGSLLIDEAAAKLQTTMRELLVDAAALEVDGALRREGALLCLVRR